MAATPPPPSGRARTPPTPLHGARYDTYEPYSPRRSKRSTAHANPYSSFNSDRSPKPSHISTPPPTTVKKARFARAPTQLSSPPSSPMSPVNSSGTSPQQFNIHNTHTPRKPRTTQHSKPTPSSSKHLAAPTTMDPATMLPTPSKTPSKKPHRPGSIASTARILSFQPNHPNDVMPSPRRIKAQQQQARSHNRTGMHDFDLYNDDYESAGGRQVDGIEIYTDVNARVPTLDEGEDNPFVGPKRTGRAKKGGRKSRSDAQEEREREIQEAVRREEGVAYVFRGKTIFRRFEEPSTAAHNQATEASSDSPIPRANSTSSTPEYQRRLKRQAGASAQRPLTRSSLKPRLLFPSEDQILDREGDIDEEAETDLDIDVDGGVEIDEMLDTNDIEMGDASTSADVHGASPVHRVKGKGRMRGAIATPSPVHADDETQILGTAGGVSIKSSNGFDTWQRTKAGRKRAGDAVVKETEGGVEVVGRGKRIKKAEV